MEIHHERPLHDYHLSTLFAKVGLRKMSTKESIIGLPEKSRYKSHVPTLMDKKGAHPPLTRTYAMCFVGALSRSLYTSAEEKAAFVREICQE